MNTPDTADNSLSREQFQAQLRAGEFQKSLRTIYDIFGFYPSSEHEAETVKALHTCNDSGLSYLDQVSSRAYAKCRSNADAIRAVGRSYDLFKKSYNEAVENIDSARLVAQHLEGASGSFATALPEHQWQQDAKLRSALMAVSHFTELQTLADTDSEVKAYLPMPFSGLTDKEAGERISELLGVMTARGLKSMLNAMENAEYGRFYYWADRVGEAAEHAFVDDPAGEEMNRIARIAMWSTDLR
jgi:hypothetical protein